MLRVLYLIAITAAATVSVEDLIKIPEGLIDGAFKFSDANESIIYFSYMAPDTCAALKYYFYTFIIHKIIK